jgi:hypothetical protein
MNIHFIGHEQDVSFVSAYRKHELGLVSVLHKALKLRLVICARYSWGVELNIGFEVSIGNM